jgi:hypothetical protein
MPSYTLLGLKCDRQAAVLYRVVVRHNWTHVNETPGTNRRYTAIHYIHAYISCEHARSACVRGIGRQRGIDDCTARGKADALPYIVTCLQLLAGTCRHRRLSKHVK